MKNTKPAGRIAFESPIFASDALEHVQDGVKFEYRRGYHVDEQRNMMIPLVFRRPDRFYHWHTDGAIVGFFIIANSKKMKGDALAMLLLTKPDACSLFGLTNDHLKVYDVE